MILSCNNICKSFGSDDIIKNASFHIEDHEKAAIVGINGAGKSTIVKLLCGFYMPDEGHIYINGTDLATMDLDVWYRSLAAVFQDAFTYSFSIADNVTCSMGEDYDAEKCREALKDAGLWEKIQKLPQKENTFIGKEVSEDGIHLSGGETQKLAIARAIAKDAPVLILDEPTSSLDDGEVEKLFVLMRQLKDKGIGIIFVTHFLEQVYAVCDRKIGRASCRERV